MIKALLLTNLFPSVHQPTRGVFSRYRFCALSSHCETRVVSPHPWWTRTRRPVEWLCVPCDRSSGIETTYPTYWSLPGKPQVHGWGMYASLRPHLNHVYRKFPFEVILAAWAYPDAVAAARLARDFNCPLVTMVLGSDVNEFTKQPGLRKQIQWGLSRSQRVVAVSNALRDRVVELGIGPDRVIVQHNGVEGDRFTIRDRREVRARLNLPLDRPLVGYVGNFKPEKGTDVLIEALGLLKRSGRTDLFVALVGSGELESKLLGRVRELELESQVRFCGHRPHGEIPDWISAFDMLCLPSHREGCPNVVLESLASGRTVVASHVGGVPELLNGENGITVPPGDAEALAQGIEAALSRSWDPGALRASVPFLSWDRFGLTLRDTLAVAIEEWHAKPRTKVSREDQAA